MKYARLVVTDGDAIVDLLNPQKSFATDAWRQRVAQIKAGGVWQESSLSGGRRLVSAQYQNTAESFPVCLSAARQDIAIRALQDLLRLMVKAREYYVSDWQDEPVWIESRAVYETNTRYAIVAVGTIPDLDQLYGTAFTDSAVLPDLILEVERDHWTSYLPGTATAVAISASETYDGRNLGNVDSTGTEIATTAEEVYIINKRNMANVTDIYVDNGGVWGANLMDAALPFDLLPAVPAVNDAIYFGIDTTLANSGPFNNLVFDLSTTQVGCTILWEYWNGAAWGTFQAHDNTNANGDLTGQPFDTAGVRSVYWRHPSNWATRDISIDGGPAITGYFVRARVTVIVAPTPPTQQNRDIYSITWPYVNIGLDQIRGDVPAIARTLMRNRSAPTPAAAFQDAGYGSKVVVGLRSYSRGSQFTAYLNFSDEQNPTGVTVTADTNTAFVNYIQSPTGRVMRYTPLGVEGESRRAFIALNTSLGNQFLGEFHAFARVTRVGGTAASIPMRLAVFLGGSSGTRIYRSTLRYAQTAFPYEAVDFGVVPISPKGLSQSDEFSEIIFNVYAAATGAGPTMDFIDLILIPIDEWAAVIQRPNETSLGDTDLFNREATRTKMVDAGSVLKPKEWTTALLKQGDTSRATCVYQTIANNEFILQANQRQRLWFLTVFRDNNVGRDTTSHTIREYKNERYLGPRGNR